MRAERTLCYLLFTGLVAWAVDAAPIWAADTIQVENNFDVSFILSDLIVYGDGTNKRIIKEPSNETDDEEIPAHGSRVFTVDFDIKRYIISTSAGSGATYREWETIIFNVRLVEAKRLGFVRDPTGQSFVALSIDGSVQPSVVPPVGTIVPFNNGLNSSFPGWFVGRAIDYNSGQVTNAYTGNVEIVSSVLVTLARPVPALSVWGSYALLLLLLSAGAFLIPRLIR